MISSQRSSQSAGVRTGFTLVEIMVVIVVIAILAAFLVPQISGVFQTVDEFAVINEIQQLDISIEKFKEEFGFYPPDISTFVDENDMLPYLNLISPSHLEDSENFPGETISRLEHWWDLVGEELQQNPEASLWFWLSQLHNHAQYPLTGPRKVSPDELELLDTSERRVFYDFRTTQLEHIALTPGGDIDASGNISNYEVTDGSNYRLFRYLQYGSEIDNARIGVAPVYHYVPNSSYAFSNLAIRKLGRAITDVANDDFYNSNSFQVIAPGYDEALHVNLVNGDPYDVGSGPITIEHVKTIDKTVDAAADDGNTMRDNIANFSESRLDVFVKQEESNQ